MSDPPGNTRFASRRKAPRHNAFEQPGAGLDLSQVLDALPSALYMTDAGGRITYYNEAAASLWGQRPELGKSKWCGSWRLHSPDGRPLAHDQCPMATTLRKRLPIRGVEAIAERPDGTTVPFFSHPTAQQLLIAEIKHRIKNTLATVQSVAR